MAFRALSVRINTFLLWLPPRLISGVNGVVRGYYNKFLEKMDFLKKNQCICVQEMLRSLHGSLCMCVSQELSENL